MTSDLGKGNSSLPALPELGEVSQYAELFRPMVKFYIKS